jgi:hypothetical protein
VSVRGGADEYAGYVIILPDILEIVAERAIGEEGGELFLPIGVVRADIFQADIEMAEQGIEIGHAMDPKADKGIALSGMEKGGLKILLQPVMVIPPQELFQHGEGSLNGQVP